MISRRGIFIFLLVAAALLGGFWSRHLLLSNCLQWYLKGYCHHRLDSEFSYRHIHYDGNVWEFDYPVLQTSSPLEEGGYRFEAAKATAVIDISWLSRTIDLSVTLESPHLDIGKDAVDFRQALTNSSEEYGFFRVHSHFEIPQGSVLAHQVAGENARPFFFSLNAACEEHNEGCLTLWFDPDQQQTNGIQVLLSELPVGGVEIAVDCHAVDCSSLSSVLKQLSPALAFGDLAQGVIDGKLVLTHPTGALPYASGRLVSRDLSVDLPHLECHMYIPEVIIDFAEDHTMISQETLGLIEIPHEATLLFYKNNIPVWVVDQLKGTIAFKSDAGATLDFDAVCSSPLGKRTIAIDGAMQLSDPSQRQAAINVYLEGLNMPSLAAHLSLQQTADQGAIAEMGFQGVSSDDISFLQHVFSHLYPKCRQVQMQEGSIDAEMTVKFQGMQPAEIKVEHVAARDLHFFVAPWNIEGKFAEAHGGLSFDLSAPHPIDTWNLDIVMGDGEFYMRGVAQPQWELSSIQANFSIKQGIIQPSVLRGNIAGLSGEIEFGGMSSAPTMKIDFQGKIAELMPIFPAEVQKALDRHFADDSVVIRTLAKQEKEGLNFSGNLEIKNSQQQNETVLFGFLLQRTVVNERLCDAQHHLQPLIEEYCSEMGLEAIHAIVPQSIVKMALMEQSPQSHAKWLITDGWLTAQQLPLDKYVAPFIFPLENFHLSGSGDFCGTFDQHKVVLHYDAYDFSLHNDDLSVEIPHFAETTEFPNSCIATHTFDFDKRHSFGTIPVRSGTYFEKNSGLLFTDISTTIFFDGDFMHVAGIEAFCNGIFCSGDIDVDWRMPGEGLFEVDVRVEKMDGTVAQVQHFLSHFEKTPPFLKIPMEGTVGIDSGGCHLHFAFQPQDYHLYALAQGSITDGTLSYQEGDLRLQDVGVRFSYDHQEKLFEFTDLQGTLLLGTLNHLEEYPVAGKKIRFSEDFDQDPDFDVWVGDKENRLLSVRGKIIPLSYENAIAIELDKEYSHFGHFHPSDFQMVLKPGFQVESCSIAFDFALDRLLTDLQGFNKTGLLFLSRSFLKQLGGIEYADGDLSANIQYSNESGVLRYEVTGNDIGIGSQRFHQFILQGKKKGDIWTVDQLSFGDISLAFDLCKESDIWNISFLGLRLGRSLLMGMEGCYHADMQYLEAKINLLEVDLFKLKEWSPFRAALDEFDLAGNVRATGFLNVNFDRLLSDGGHVDMHLTGSWDRAKVKGLQLQEMRNLSFHYDSREGCRLNHVQTELLSVKDGLPRASLSLDKLYYNPRNAIFEVTGLGFSIPTHHLTWVTENLQQSFPTVFTQSVADIVVQSKKHSDLQGELQLSLSGDEAALHLKLEDGLYNFMGKEYDLSHFIFDYDPFAIKVAMDYYHQGYPIKIEAYSSAPKFESGVVILSEPWKTFADPSGTQLPLTVHWQIDPYCGFYIHQISGGICGIFCSLEKDRSQALNSDSLRLTGYIDFDISQAQALVGPAIADKLSKCQLGSGYRIQGDFIIDKAEEKSLMDSLVFQGVLLGKEFECYGYHLQSLSASVLYRPSEVQITQLTLADVCGRLQMEQCVIYQKDQHWYISVPSLTVTNFRPSQLRLAGSSVPHASKSLLVRHLEVHDLLGEVGNSASLTGYGLFDFINPPKKNLSHTIFKIPIEILTHIGLDMSVLTPVRGTVEYKIQDEKIVLQRFKDIYSRRRLSKFYLPNSSQASYLDFDGNLHVQFRMKQYNLLFKLAELFTVSIQGTWKNPVYTLQRQMKQEPNLRHEK